MDALNTTERWTYDDWRARANHAIATSRLQRRNLVTARREKLSLLRETLRIHAAYLRKQDPEGLRRLCTRIADYYRADGRLRISKRVDGLIDREVSRVAASPSSAVSYPKNSKRRA